MGGLLRGMVTSANNRVGGKISCHSYNQRLTLKARRVLRKIMTLSIVTFTTSKSPGCRVDSHNAFLWSISLVIEAVLKIASRF